MSSDPTVLETIRIWEAAGPDEISSVWSGLLGKYQGRTPEFRSTELNDQRAGWLFERLIIEAFRLDRFVVHHPFRIATTAGDKTREENDGLIIEGWQGFLVESKFTSDPIGIEPILRLHMLVEHRPIGTLGLFFSGSGFTDPAIESAAFLKPIRVLLFDRTDLEWAFQSPNRMMEMVRKKWEFALKFGKPHLPIAEAATS